MYFSDTRQNSLENFIVQLVCGGWGGGGQGGGSGTGDGRGKGGRRQF